MDDKDRLDRNLQSIGKKCFVKYFEKLSDLRLSNPDLIELLMKEGGYTELACRTRVSKFRQIIREGRVLDALKKIAMSKRLSEDVIEKAKTLMSSIQNK